LKGLRALLDKFRGNSDAPIWQAVADHGRPYIGIDRPKGFRQRALKQCYANAGRLAMAGRGIYVEGFATISQGDITPHAWITLDGLHAIDPTWSMAPSHFYYGIQFPTGI
jgi:hypothetical protein